jgi:HTH-type transcriptional regulator, global nitrogen regulator NrpRI
MKEKIEKKRLAILRILKESEHPVPSQKIVELLHEIGQEISERTVRFHLKDMDDDGLTEYVERRGRRITAKGILETKKARIVDKVGFINSKIDYFSYKMNFDLSTKKGTVVINISYISIDDIKNAIKLLIPAFKIGFTMGNLIGLYLPGETVGNDTVPEGYIGIGTVCSFTLNGILTARGIPVNSLFGGLLEIENRKPSRFIEIIKYDGTSIDPLEIFIKSGMTDVTRAAELGKGRIGAHFLEAPGSARDEIHSIGEEMKHAGLGTFLTLGWPGHSILQVPISWGRMGGIVTGGLNPIAILEESGINVISKAVSGLVEYESLFPALELVDRYKH